MNESNEAIPSTSSAEAQEVNQAASNKNLNAQVRELLDQRADYRSVLTDVIAARLEQLNLLEEQSGEYEKLREKLNTDPPDTTAGIADVIKQIEECRNNINQIFERDDAFAIDHRDLLPMEQYTQSRLLGAIHELKTQAASTGDESIESEKLLNEINAVDEQFSDLSRQWDNALRALDKQLLEKTAPLSFIGSAQELVDGINIFEREALRRIILKLAENGVSIDDPLMLKYKDGLQHRIFTVFDSQMKMFSVMGYRENGLLQIRDLLGRSFSPLDEQPEYKPTLDQLEVDLAAFGQYEFLATLRDWRRDWQNRLQQGATLELSSEELGMQQQAKEPVIASLNDMLDSTQQHSEALKIAQRELESDHDWLLTTVTEHQLTSWREHQVKRLMLDITNNAGSKLTTKEKYELAYEKAEEAIERIGLHREEFEDEDNYQTIETQWKLISSHLTTELKIGDMRWQQEQRLARLKQLEQKVEQQNNNALSQTEVARSENSINVLSDKIADIRQLDAKLSKIFNDIEKATSSEDDAGKQPDQLVKEAQAVGAKVSEAMEQLEDAYVLQQWQGSVQIAQEKLLADPLSETLLRTAHEQHLQFHELYCAVRLRCTELELKRKDSEAERERLRENNTSNNSGSNNENEEAIDNQFDTEWNSRGIRLSDMPPALKSLTELLFEMEIPLVWDKDAIIALETERERQLNSLDFRLRGAIQSEKSSKSDEASIKSTTIKERLAGEVNPQLKSMLNSDAVMAAIQRELEEFNPPKKLDEVLILKLWVDRLHTAIIEAKINTPITKGEIDRLIQKQTVHLARYERMLGEQGRGQPVVDGEHLSEAIENLPEQPRNLLFPNTSSLRYNAARLIYQTELNRAKNETWQSLSAVRSLLPPDHETLVALQEKLTEDRSSFPTHIDLSTFTSAQEELQQQLQNASDYLAQPRNVAMSEKFQQEMQRLDGAPAPMSIPLNIRKTYQAFSLDEATQALHAATKLDEARKLSDTLLTDITSEAKRLRKDEQQRALNKMQGNTEPGIREQADKWEKFVALGQEKAMETKRKELNAKQGGHVLHKMREQREKEVIRKAKIFFAHRSSSKRSEDQYVFQRLTQSRDPMHRDTFNEWVAKETQIEGDIKKFVSDQTTGANLPAWLTTSKVRTEMYREVLASTLGRLNTLRNWESNGQPLPHLLEEMTHLKTRAEREYKSAVGDHLNELINDILPAMQKQTKRLGNTIYEPGDMVATLEKETASIASSLHLHKQQLEQMGHTMDGEQLTIFSDQVSATYDRISQLQFQINNTAYKFPDIAFQQEQNMSRLMQEQRRLHNKTTTDLTSEQSVEVEGRIASTRIAISEFVTALPDIWRDRIAECMHNNHRSMHQHLQDKLEETEKALLSTPVQSLDTQLASIKIDLKRAEERLAKLHAATDVPSEKFSAHLQEWLHESESIIQARSKMVRELKSIRQQIPSIAHKTVELSSREQSPESPVRPESSNEAEQLKGVKRKQEFPDTVTSSDEIKKLINEQYKSQAFGWKQVIVPKSGIPDNSTLLLTHPQPCAESDLQFACVEVAKGKTINGVHKPAEVAIVHVIDIPEHNIKEIVRVQGSEKKTISGFSLKENKVKQGDKRRKLA